MNSTIKDFYLNKKKRIINNVNENKKEISIGIYRRVSTQEQATDGQSIEAQKDKILKFVNFDTSFENTEHNIIDFCDNGYSGKNLDRPGIISLIEVIKQQQIDFVVVVKLDRLSRHLPDMYFLLELLNKYDIGFISINEKIDTKTAHGRFFIGILSSLSQLEREQTSERVQSVFKELIHKQPLGGKAPFGYFYFKPEKCYFPYDKEQSTKVNLPPLKIPYYHEILYPATIIPLIFNWYKINPNFRQLALKLTEMHFPTANVIHAAVKDFFKLSEDNRVVKVLEIESLQPWNPRSVKDILINPFYTGSRIWNRKDNLNKKKRPFQEWIYVSDAHKELISIQEFSEVGELI